jgi:hypothetical protein
MPGTDHERALFNTLRSIGMNGVAKVASPDETEVVEDVAHDEAKGGSSGPSLVLGRVTSKNFFRHPDAHPIVLDMALIRKYGPEWLDWEPETLEYAIPHDFGTQPASAVNLGKLNACKALHLMDSFWERWEVFGWCTMGLNGIFPDPQVMQVPTVPQVLIAADIANRIREDVAWSDEVKSYLGAVFKFDGVIVPIPPLEFVPTVGTDVDVAAIDRQWDSVRASGHAPNGATVVDEQLRRMLFAHQMLEESRTRLREQMELLPHV